MCLPGFQFCLPYLSYPSCHLSAFCSTTSTAVHLHRPPSTPATSVNYTCAGSPSAREYGSTGLAVLSAPSSSSYLATQFCPHPTTHHSTAVPYPLHLTTRLVTTRQLQLFHLTPRFHISSPPSCVHQWVYNGLQIVIRVLQ